MSGVVARRFWQVYNVVILVLVVGIGIVTMLGGGTRGLLTGAGMILVGAWLAARTWRTSSSRATTGPPQVSDLQVGVDGVLLVQGDADSPGTARLAWDDVAAVVASPVAPEAAGGRSLYYLHFIPTSPDRVELDGVPGAMLRAKAAVADVPVSAGAGTVWVCAGHGLDQAFAILDAVRTVRPDLRIVDSIRRSS